MNRTEGRADDRADNKGSETVCHHSTRPAIRSAVA